MLFRSAVLGVTASGTGSLTYQWLFQSNIIVGATGSTLVLSNLTRTNSGYYAVTVANNAGSVTSSNALLRVLSPLRIAPVTALGGGRYRIAFTYADGGLLYDWDLGGLELQGSTNMFSPINWLTLTNNPILISNGVGLAEFVRTNIPPATFYRIRAR